LPTLSIDVKNLTKKYGKFKAIDNVSYEVERGKIYAVLGPNGAGKTTMFRCILGLLNFEGSILVDGRDTRKAGKWVRENIGYLPQHSAPYDDLSVEDNLKFYAGVKGVRPERVVETLKDIRLLRFRDRKAQALSGGMKQRLMLGISQLSDPQILILDEPTANLDVQGQLRFRELLGELLGKGKSVLVSTHLLREAHEIRLFKGNVIVINRGRLIGSGLVDDFMKKADLREHLFIDVGTNDPKKMMQVAEKSGCDNVEVHKGQIIVACEHEDKFRLLKALDAAGFPPSSFRVDEPSLEVAFMKATEA
jgi:ABC-type multidrug transport system ATPase subunit